MGGQTKNQHYIPQFYLRRFAEGRKNRFSVFDKAADKILENQNPKNFASKRYYYDIDSDTLLEMMSDTFRILPNAINNPILQDSQFIESALNRVETSISSIFSAIEENPEVLYDTDNQSKILIFLHQMIYRVDSYREQNGYITKQLVDFLHNLGLSESDIAAVKEKHGIRETAKQDQLYQIVNIASMLRTAIPLLELYVWYYGIVEESYLHLITSDNPAFQIFLGFNDICFPISPKKALIFRIKDADAPLISRDKPNGHKIILSQRSVFAYNLIQEANARRFMFGNSEAFKALKGLHRLSEIIKVLRQQQ